LCFKFLGPRFLIKGKAEIDQDRIIQGAVS
jgi:hypothetical protein